MSTGTLRVVHDPDRHELTVQLAQGTDIQSAPPVAFRNPLSPADRAELRWYLEDYLRFPVGIYPDRARRVEEKMAGWGGAMFDALFGAGKARDFYVLLKDRGLKKFGFEVRQGGAEARLFPWELLYDTAGSFYLVHQFGSFARSQEASAAGLLEPHPAGERLRVLLVIARPFGQRDVPYRTVSRPMMELLQRPGLRDRIHVEVLRPPSFAQFVQAVSRTREGGVPYFDVVHFDGHGGFGTDAGGRLDSFDSFKGPHGKLLFETDGGEKDEVEASNLRQVLGQHKVPLFVLNACRSGMEALEEQTPQAPAHAMPTDPSEAEARKGLEERSAAQSRAITSMAGTLLDAGAHGVVAMGYVVQAKAAAVFMRGFYQSLLEGRSAAEAVSAGRVALASDKVRPTRFGEKELLDWPIPVYHERVPVRLFSGGQAGQSLEALMAAMLAGQEVSVASGDGLPPAPRFGFMGRDAELLQVERALRREGAAGVTLVGIGGTGKTSLALAAARWLAATHSPQAAGGVFLHAFVDQDEVGRPCRPNLEALLRKVGWARLGDAFLRLAADQQRALVAKFLREAPCLLVLDNVESASGIGESLPLLNEDERNEIRQFVQEVCPRNGATRLLLTSRREEPWLGVNTEAVEVRGLGKDAWDELALAVLRASGLDPVLAGKAADPAWQQGFDALLQALGGHPLALQIILPRLKDRHPDDVLRGLSEGDRSLDGTLPEGASERERTLAGCVNYSFAALPEGVRARVPVLACFREWADAEQLAALCNEEGVPAAVRGTPAETWAGVLREVEATGLVRQEAPNLYRLSPLLPWFLRSSLSEGESEGLEKATIRYHRRLAYTLTDALRNQGAEKAVAFFPASQASIYHALELARRAPAYDEALTLYECLDDFYSLSGQHARSVMLLEALRKEVPPPPSREPASGHARLWLALTLRHGNKLLAAGDLTGAEGCYKEVLDAAPDVDEVRGAIYFNLGRVAEERRKLEEAEDWYRKALDVRRRLGDGDLAQLYRALGNLARERHRLEDAARWYGEALQFALGRGDQGDEADSHHLLGVVAQEQNKLEEAEKRYKLALDVRLRLGQTGRTADSYHQLGKVAQERHDLDQAEQWYRKALEVRLQSAGEQEAAKTYHQLGLVAKKRYRLGEAEDWFRKSLEMELRLANEHGAAMTYVELGEMATARFDWPRAEEWYNKALEVFLRLRSEKYVAETFLGLGKMWNARQNYVAAKSCFEKALEICLRIGEEHSAANNHLSLSAIARELGDLAAGEDAANKALGAFVRLGDDYGAALAHNNLGGLAAAREDNELAATHFLHALEQFKRVGDRPRMAPTSFNLATVLAALGDAKCVKYFLIATAFWLILEDAESAGRAIDGLAWALRKLGRPYGDVEQAWRGLRGAPVPAELRELILSRLNGAEEDAPSEGGE